MKKPRSAVALKLMTITDCVDYRVHTDRKNKTRLFSTRTGQSALFLKTE